MRTLLLLCCAIALACGGATPTTQTTPVEVADVGSFEIPESARQPEVEVTLLDPGTGERRALRFSSQVGDESTVQLDIGMLLEIRMDGQGGQTATPPIQTRYVQRTTAVDAQGRMRAEFEMQGVEVQQDGTPMAAQLTASMRPLGDATGWFVMDSRGRTLAAEFNIPNADQAARDSMDNIRNTMTQVAPPFPEEPVGEGARWTARSVLNGKITMQQVATYTLVSLEPDGVVLDVQVSQTADPQPVETGQPDAQAQLVSMEGSGEGRVTVNTSRLIPTQSATELRSQSEMEIRQGDEQHSLSLGLQMTLTLAGS